MYDALLVRHCAPTLTGLKTGSLFSCPFGSREAMLTCLLRWNRLLNVHGLHIFPLHTRKGRTLIYICSLPSLKQDLEHKQAAELLTGLNYPLPCPYRCIAHLMEKLTDTSSFPHEIGLFLGYPPEDVLGFIRDPAACKFSGCWKVYGDVSAAQIRFESYHSCTQICCSLLTGGAGLEQLAAASSYTVRNS